MKKLKIGRFEILKMAQSENIDHPIYQVACDECDTVHNMSMDNIIKHSNSNCDCFETENILFDCEKITITEASSKYRKCESELKSIVERNGCAFQTAKISMNAALPAFMIAMFPAYQIIHDINNM